MAPELSCSEANTSSAQPALRTEQAAPRTNDQDVVELLHAINFGEQLVHHGVMHARAAGHAAPLLADGINLIKNDDVHPTVGSKLWERAHVRNVPSLIAESNPKSTTSSQ